MKKSLLIKKANYRRILLTKWLGLSLVVVFGLVVIIVVTPFFFRSVVQLVWYPFDAVRIWAAESGSSLPQYLRERSALVAELTALKITVATEQGTENTIRKLQVENNELRTRAGAVPESRLLARVIGRPNQMPYDMLMLDRGRVHGLVESAPVFLGTDQVIGFVSRVHERTSLVTLVTTAGFTSSAYVIGPNIYTFAEGLGGGVLRVRVPQGIMLQMGDLVVLPAIDSGVYGAIAFVEAAPTQPEQYGYLTTEIPLQSLYYVSVGREPQTTNTYTEAEVMLDDIRAKLFTVDLPPGVLVTPEARATTSTTTVGIPQSETVVPRTTTTGVATTTGTRQ
jgi:cell shape-determining protein MreC